MLGELHVEPQGEIHFQGPYNRVVVEYLRVANRSTKSIAFEVMASTKRYYVPSYSHLIQPGMSLDLPVYLWPEKSIDEPNVCQLENRNNDKLTILWTFVEASLNFGLIVLCQSQTLRSISLRCVFDYSADLEAPAGRAILRQYLCPFEQRSRSCATTSQALCPFGHKGDHFAKRSIPECVCVNHLVGNCHRATTKCNLVRCKAGIHVSDIELNNFDELHEKMASIILASDRHDSSDSTAT